MFLTPDHLCALVLHCAARNDTFVLMDGGVIGELAECL
jgi:hypothetical protein